MGAFAVFMVKMIASVLVSKAVTELTDNEALGAIAGMAAGMGVGAVAGGAGAGAAASGMTEGGQSAVMTMDNVSGSALADPGINTMDSSIMSDGMFNDALNYSGPDVASGAGEAGSNGFMSGINDFVSNIDPNEWMKLGGGLLQGYSAGKISEEKLDIERDANQISRDRLNFDQNKHNNQGAFGVTNDGRVIAINNSNDLMEMNQRLAQSNSSAFNNFNNMSSIDRPEGGYMSSFGRFSAPVRNTEENR